MTTKHTPGPWHVGRGADGHPIVYVDCPASEGSGPGIAHVCPIPHMRSTQGTKEANAHLIAAAPDLLAACDEALNHIEEGTTSYHYISAAIAKARGE